MSPAPLKSGRNIWVYILLAVVVMAVVYLIRSFQLSGGGGPQDQTAAREPSEAKRIALQQIGAELARKAHSPELTDGSFNPLPPKEKKPALSTKPQDAAFDHEWRARYAKALESQKPDGTTFYVYAFRDGTKNGVGIHSTYGSRILVNAALALWTRGTVLGFDPPRHYGMPDKLEVESGAIPDLDSWAKRALGDPAAESASHLLIGNYEDGPGADEILLHVYAVEAARPDALISLADGRASLQKQGFAELESMNQRTIQKAVEQLIALGIVRKREGAKAPQDLKAELSEISVMLDTPDSWIVMDGIDRALQLATLNPKSFLPLQAAAYGMHLLGEMTLLYGPTNLYCVDYALRAYALAQLALMMNPEAEFPKLIAALTCGALLHDPKVRLASYGDQRKTNHSPEFFGLQEIIEESHEDLRRAAPLDRFPNWLVLQSDHRIMRHFGSTPYMDYMKAQTKLWPDYDFYLQAWVRMNTIDYYFPGEGNESFYRILKASAVAASGLSAVEAATLAEALPTQKRELLLKEVEAALGEFDAEPGFTSVPREFWKLSDAAAMRPKPKLGLVATSGYFELRAALMKATAGWPPPANNGHPYFKILRICRKHGADALRNADARRYPSGFTGLEFCPAERVLLAQRRDALATLVLGQFLDDRFSSYPDLNLMEDAYESAAPENAAQRIDYAGRLRDRLAEKDAEARYSNALSSALVLLPLDAERYYWAGREQFYGDDPRKGEKYLSEYNRADPFTPNRFLKMAELCARYARHAAGVKYYDDYLKFAPLRYDVRNDRNWSACQLGQSQNPKFKEMYAEPARLLSGNSSFHYANIAYLRDWLQDYEAAKKAAGALVAAKGNPGRFELAKIQKLAGNVNAGLGTLSKIDLSQLSGLWRANAEADLSLAYQNFDKLDLAEEHLKIAMGIDDWAGGVISASKSLAFSKGDYERALSECKRYEDRYGPSPNLQYFKANCHYHKKELEKAETLLSKEVFDKKLALASPDCAIFLIRIHAEQGEKDKARKALNCVLECYQRTAGYIYDAAEAYKKVDPVEGQRIQDDRFKLMAGEDL